MRTRALAALAWRESRFARRRLLLFLSAISLGVAALVAVRGLAGTLARGVRTEARTLLGADLTLSSRAPFGPATTALLDSLAAAGAPVARRTSFNSMVLHPGTGGTRLVQVRAPEPGYPFYGSIETEPEGRWTALHAGRHAVVDPALLDALGGAVGDSVALGESRFRVVATLRRVPGDVDIASTFAPRVFIPAAEVEATGLTGFGSRVDHEAFVKLPGASAAERLAEAYRPLLRRERVRARTVADQQETLTRAFGRLTSYLGLVGVLALLLGGIGVASAMQAYMARKADTVAVLRCLGATGGQVLAIYLAQAGLMGLGGAALGVALGVAVQWVLPSLLSGLLPVQVPVEIDGAVIALGLVVGVWTALAFALLPLLRVRAVSPLGALRREVEPPPAPRDRLRAAAWGVIAVSLHLLLWLQVGRPAFAAALLAGIGAALGTLWVLAWALTRGVRRVPRGGLAYPLRQGVANLHRPGNQTRAVVLALGGGVFLLATLLLTQHNLLLPLRADAAGDRGNLLLWDVQDDQAVRLEVFLRSAGVPVTQRAAIVPMRVAAVQGVEVRPWTAEEEEAAGDEGGERVEGWAARREYRSTYRDTVVASERLLEGRLWDRTVGARQVSLEREIADELGLVVGDTLTWDVQGVRIPTVVTSLREVDWARFEPNFFAVFPTELLEEAPKTWVVLGRAAGGAPPAVQRGVVERFPNVAVLDLTLVQETLDGVVGKISAVIRFLAAFSVVTGFVVLLGAVSTSRLQRVRESVLLKAIGATRRQIATILLAEYLVLGLLAAVAGIGLALGAGWALARWVFSLPFETAPLQLGGLGVAVAALAAVVGLWASREVFGRTALEAIREE